MGVVAVYWASYVDERERVERVCVEAVTAPQALRVARAAVRRRADEARQSYAGKGIRLRIRRGYYQILLLTDEAGRPIYPAMN